MQADDALATYRAASVAGRSWSVLVHQAPGWLWSRDVRWCGEPVVREVFADGSAIVCRRSGDVVERPAVAEGAGNG